MQYNCCNYKIRVQCLTSHLCTAARSDPESKATCAELSFRRWSKSQCHTYERVWCLERPRLALTSSSLAGGQCMDGWSVVVSGAKSHKTSRMVAHQNIDSRLKYNTQSSGVIAAMTPCCLIDGLLSSYTKPALIGSTSCKSFHLTLSASRDDRWLLTTRLGTVAMTSHITHYRSRGAVHACDKRERRIFLVCWWWRHSGQ